MGIISMTTVVDKLKFCDAMQVNFFGFGLIIKSR